MISETDNRAFADHTSLQNVHKQIFQINGQQQVHSQQIFQVFQYLEQQQQQLNQIMQIIQQIEKKQIEPLVINHQQHQTSLEQIQHNQKKLSLFFISSSNRLP